MADTKAKPKKRVKRKELAAVETEPDAWQRFESAIQKIAPPKKAKPKDNAPS